MPPSLRSGSKFIPFDLTLTNNARLIGISYIPPLSSTSAPSSARKPLLVLIHGGTCTPYHFDLDDRRTYSIVAETLGISIVAIHRPGYGGSTSFLPIRDEEDERGETLYHHKTARWLHDFIFPAVWDEFGIKHGCSGLVAIGHSMGGMQTVIAAGLYCRDPSPKYLLLGIVISGMGCRFISRPELNEGFKPDEPLPDQILFKPGVMDLLMLSDKSLTLCDEEVYPKVAQMDVGMPKEELLSLVVWWPTHWREYAAEITVPVLYGLGELDWLWETNEEHVHEFKEAFLKCPRFDGNLVAKAPHCIEWSRVGTDWSKRVGAWAVDVAHSGGGR